MTAKDHLGRIRKTKNPTTFSSKKIDAKHEETLQPSFSKY